jgi:hypothetical protein
MSSSAARKTGKKNRKWNRNKVFCTAYRNSNTREKNKAKRLARHLKHHPLDKSAHHCFTNLARYHG